MSPKSSDGDRPEYGALLETLAANRPRLTRALRKAEENRRHHVTAFLDGACFRGLESLLLWLDGAAVVYEGNEDLRRIASLIRRAIADFETAAEAILSGYLSTAADAMRDVMEIEMLLLDFILDDSSITESLRASPADRERFRPREVRKRLAGAGINRLAGPTARGLDYKAHSAALHVNPTTPIAKGLIPESEREAGMLSDMGYWEIFEHARRLVLPVRAHLVRVGHGGIEGDLGPVANAWARTRQMQIMYTTMLTAPAELRQQLGREPTAREVLERVADAVQRGPSFGSIEDGEGASSK